MSKHHNYNNYSKQANKQVEVTEQEVKVTNDEVETTVETPEADVIPDSVEPQVILVSGKVVDCKKLNVREQASSDANVVCVIDKDEEIKIDQSESTDDFYKVCTAAGIEGYCMKRFIMI